MKWKKDITPLIMWCILFSAIVILGFIRQDRLPGEDDGLPSCLDGCFVVLYLLWMVIELGVTGRDVDTGGKRTRDFMTCQLYLFIFCLLKKVKGNS